MECELELSFKCNNVITRSMVLAHVVGADTTSLTIPLDVVIDVLDMAIVRHPHAVRILDVLLPAVMSMTGDKNDDTTFDVALKSVCSDDVDRVFSDLTDVFMSEPAALDLHYSESDPLCIVGRFSGDPATLQHLFRTNQVNTGRAEHTRTRYLFLGDYSGRCRHSLVSTLVLFCLKLLYPDVFYLLRGQMECEPISRVFGVFDQFSRSFSVALWRKCMNVFDTIPLASLVSHKRRENQRFLCVPNGVCAELLPRSVAAKYTDASYPDSLDSRDLSPSERLRRRVAHHYPRPMAITDSGLTMGLTWNEYDSDDDTEKHLFWEAAGRICHGYVYATPTIAAVCDEYSVDCIVASPGVQEEGRNLTSDKMHLSLFSCVDYCGEFDNKACVVILQDGEAARFDIWPK